MSEEDEKEQEEAPVFFFGKNLGWHIFFVSGGRIYFFLPVSLAIFLPSPLLLRTERSEESACRLNKDCRAVLTAL